MSTIELRKKLISQINKTSDAATLRDLLRLLEINIEDEDVYRLSEDQKKGAIEAQYQIKSGDFYSNEAVNKEVDNWLNK